MIAGRRILLTAAIACLLEAQQPPASQEPVFRVTVNLVQIDAVVTDSKGRHVGNLTAKDFEILEDGRPQRITNFSYVEQAAARETPTAPPRKEARAPAVVPLPPMRLRPEQVRRTIALVVDDLGLSWESTHFVRRSLKKFVDEQMQPGDLVAVIRTRAGMGAMQRFTADKRLLHAAIERVRWYPGRSGISPFDPLGGDPLEKLAAISSITGGRRISTPGIVERAKDLEAYRQEYFTIGTLGALRYVIDGLRELPGRKSVILFSDGLSLWRAERREHRERLLTSFRGIIDRANRSSVVIYAMDARGLQSMMPGADEDVAYLYLLGPTELERRITDRASAFLESQQALQYMAGMTGGFAVYNTNDLNWGLDRVLEDQAGYYLIGYKPDSSTFRAGKDAPDYHKIRVRVKLGGLRVRSRSGFYGVVDEEARPAPRTSAEQLIAGLRSPFGGAIGLRLTSLFSIHPQLGATVRNLMHVDLHDLTFSESAGGAHVARIDVAAMTYGEDGAAVDQKVSTWELSIQDADFQDWLRKGVIYTQDVPIRKPGAYQLRVAVRDDATGKVGSASEFIEVPDVAQARLVMSGIVLGSAVEAAGPAETTHTEKPEDIEGHPAIRTFHPGQTLQFGCQLYSAALDPKTSAPNVETRVVLLREGKAVFTGNPVALHIKGQPDLNRIMVTGWVRLGSGLEAGPYVFQVIAQDKLAKEKQAFASQWIDFEVVR